MTERDRSTLRNRFDSDVLTTAPAVGRAPRTASLPPVQAKGDLAGDDVHAAAERGVSGAPTTLPHFDVIQRAFGHHDLGGVRAHVGGEAAQAAGAIGARAYATGDSVAFASTPDVHLAAHEAAHVVQQRGGVRLSGGVGRAGDDYERNADEVAARVVSGQSAQDLLDPFAHRGAGGGRAVQRDPGDEDESPASRVTARGAHEVLIFQIPRTEPMPRIGRVGLDVRLRQSSPEAELAHGDEGGSEISVTGTERGGVLGSPGRSGISVERRGPREAPASAVDHLPIWCEADFRQRFDATIEPTGGSGVQVGLAFRLATVHFGPLEAPITLNLIRNERGRLQPDVPSFTFSIPYQTTLDDGTRAELRFDFTWWPDWAFLLPRVSRLVEGAIEFGGRVFRGGAELAADGAGAAAGAAGEGADAAARAAREAEVEGAERAGQVALRGGARGALHVAGAILEPIMILYDFYTVMEHISSIIPGIEGARVLRHRVSDYADQVSSWVFGGLNQHEARVAMVDHLEPGAVAATAGGARFMSQWRDALRGARQEANRAFAALQEQGQVQALRDQYGTQPALYQALGSELATRQGVAFEPDDVMRNLDGSVTQDGETIVPPSPEAAARERERRAAHGMIDESRGPGIATRPMTSRPPDDHAPRLEGNDEDGEEILTRLRGGLVISSVPDPFSLACGAQVCVRRVSQRGEHDDSGLNLYAVDLEILAPSPHGETIVSGGVSVPNRAGETLHRTVLGRPDDR